MTKTLLERNQEQWGNANLDLIHEQTGFIETAFGGTEQQLRRLYRDVPRDLLEKFQIVPTRVNALDGDKVRILWIHDLVDDPSCEHLANGGWNNFHKLVFVSYWQQQQFINKYQIPWSHTTVIHNAIEPFPLDQNKWTNKKNVKFVYHTTPHRGLELLVPVFNKLVEKYEDKIELDVFSSYNVYGWGDRDAQFKPIFDAIDQSPQINNRGAVTNKELREVLPSYDVFAYPSTWPETSCLSLIEAMSAGLICVHSSLGALSETSNNWTLMYDFDENPNRHASALYALLDNVTDSVLKDAPNFFGQKQMSQAVYMTAFYNWNIKLAQWIHLLNSLKDMPTDIPEITNNEPVFSYST